MIVKSSYVRASRVSQGRASSALNSHLKYLQYRERDPALESRADRYLFNDEEDHVGRRAVHDDLMGERAGDIYYHRLILSPAQDEPVEDWREWTRSVMRDLEDRLDQDLGWYAVQHHNTDDPHVHVVLSGTGIDRETGREEPVELTPQDFRSLRESGREHSDYDHYHFIEDVLRDLDERDTIIQEAPEREQENERTIER
jgi:type IV secretory pathway VirD2 relaxase